MKTGEATPRNTGGFEVVAELGAREMRTGSHARVIAWTANPMPGDRDHCIAHGIDGYASKPINWDELFAEIGRVLNTSADGVV